MVTFWMFYLIVGSLLAAALLPLAGPWYRTLGRVILWLALWPLLALVMLTRRGPRT